MSYICYKLAGNMLFSSCPWIYDFRKWEKEKQNHSKSSRNIPPTWQKSWTRNISQNSFSVDVHKETKEARIQVFLMTTRFTSFFKICYSPNSPKIKSSASFIFWSLLQHHYVHNHQIHPNPHYLWFPEHLTP